MAEYDDLLKKHGGVVSDTAGLDELLAKHGGKVEERPQAKEPKLDVRKIIDESFVVPEYKGMSRGAGIATRAVAPTMVGAELGSLAGPYGTIAGTFAVPASDAIIAAVNALAGSNIPPTSETIQRLMTTAGVPGAPETQTPTERVLSTGLETMANVGKSVPALAQKGLAAAVEPKVQAIVAPASTMAGQAVTEATGSPGAGLATQLVTGGLGSVRGTKYKEAPSSELLGRVASERYKAIEDAGVKIKTKEFADSMQNIATSLRDEGYTAKAYPKVAAAIDEMTDLKTPKDWTELQALRKIVRGAQKSIDPDERRLGSILMDKFDDYIMNVPQKDVEAGDIKNINALWTDARSAYSRMKKAEVFQDMLENAQLDKSKFTQSGAENSMAKQLRDLAKNDKRMRLFTKDEQAAIEQAAKGSTTQNLLKFYGRFAPTGPVSGLFTGGATVAAPAIGIPFAAGAAASRYGATKMRESSINDLINMMRAGQTPEKIGGPFRAVAPTQIQGLLSQLEEERKYMMGLPE